MTYGVFTYLVPVWVAYSKNKHINELTTVKDMVDFSG